MRNRWRRFLSNAIVVLCGVAGVQSQSMTVDLHNGWQVKVFGTVTAGMLANPNALALMVAGILCSLLLTRSRQRRGWPRAPADRCRSGRCWLWRCRYRHRSVSACP